MGSSKGKWRCAEVVLLQVDPVGPVPVGVVFSS